MSRIKKSLTVLIMVTTSLCMNMFSKSIIASYIYSDRDSENVNYAACKFRTILFKLKGEEWYIDHVLFPQTRSREEIRLSLNNYLAIQINSNYLCEHIERASAIREALNYMAENEDTIFVPIVTWKHEFRDGILYPVMTDIENQIENTYEFDRPTGMASISFGKYDFFNDLTGDTTAPIVCFQLCGIFCSPFSKPLNKSAAYRKYCEICQESGMNAIPKNTLGINKKMYSKEEIDYFLRFALEYDMEKIAEDVKVVYIQPFTFEGNHDDPIINLNYSIEKLCCKDLDSLVRSQLQKCNIN